MEVVGRCWVQKRNACSGSWRICRVESGDPKSSTTSTNLHALLFPLYSAFGRSFRPRSRVTGGLGCNQPARLCPSSNALPTSTSAHRVAGSVHTRLHLLMHS